MSSETMPSGEPKPAPRQQSKAPAPGAKSKAAPASKRPSLKLLIGGLIALLALIVGIPRILHGLSSVSTDETYVNSHITFVAPRVSGQVMRVLVDHNNRVRKGDVLVELDPEPFRVQVAIKQAAVDVANANLIGRGNRAGIGGAGAKPAFQARSRHRGRGQPGRSHSAAGSHLGAK
jgi:membrane fusion protein, multidrug efflux system